MKMQLLVGKSIIVRKIVGSITILISLFLLFNSIYLYYCYNFTSTLYLFMYPNSVLLISAAVGFIGIILSVMLWVSIRVSDRR